MAARIPTRRKQPPTINRWYLTPYLRHHPLTAARFAEVLRDFMQRRQSALSHPLFMCLTLLIDYLLEEPALVEASRST